jgi:hypothetical protein
MFEIVALIVGALGLGALVAPAVRGRAAAKVAPAQAYIDTADAALKFKSRVGLKSPFFAPRTNDVKPTATVSGPTGLDIQVPVVECAEHPDFGARWQLCVPKFSAPGNYRIAVSSGEVYDVSVKES